MRIKKVISILLISVAIMIPVTVTAMDKEVNLHTGKVTIGGQTSENVTVSIKIEEGNKKHYVDAIHTADGYYEFKTILPLNKVYDVLVNENGSIQTFTLSTKRTTSDNSNSTETDKEDEENETDVVTNLDDNVIANVNRKATINGDVFTSKIDSELMQKIIKTVTEVENNSITNKPVIEISIELPAGKSVEDITEGRIDISKSDLRELLDATSSDIRLITPLTSITFNKDALNQIASQAQGSTVTISAQKVVSESNTYDLNVLSGEEKITDFGKGIAKVSIPYIPENGKSSSLIIVKYIDDNGKETIIGKSYYENNNVMFVAEHFSKYKIDYQEIAFEDIDGHWAKEDIDFISSREIFNGTSKTTFSPNESMTRAMLITVLGRMEGIDINQYTASVFADVEISSWFAPYVAWAKEIGIVNGTSKTTFSPNDKVTREQMATIIANYVKYTGNLFIGQNEIKGNFVDENTISTWAIESVHLMYNANIIPCKQGNTFAPKNTATRAEVSAMISKIIENVVK